MRFDWKRQRIWLVALGVALNAAGLYRYSTQGEATRLSEGLEIAGGVLIMAAVALSYQELAIFFGHRSSKLGINTLTLTILVLAGLALVNFFGYRHSKEADLTTEKLYSLSDESRQTLAGLKQDVDVLRFGQGTDSRVSDMATEYQRFSPHVHYREVDPQEKPEIARQYNVTELNKIVISSGGHNETLDSQGIGEQELTNAILKTTRNKSKTFCFTEGHGEKSIASNDAGGLAKMANSLTGEGNMTKEVNLASSGDVPSDCGALIVAGPKQPLFPQEAAAINKYLDGGGKALLLVDPETMPKLDEIFAKWNVNIGNNVVVDASGAGQRLFGIGPAVPMVIQYGESPITKNFNRTMTFFPLARTVDVADKSRSQQVQETELLKTSANSFTVPNLKVKEVRFDPKTAGPLTLGISAERAVDSGGSAKKARLVVIGNSGFATNQWAGLQRNGDLFLNAVHWLSEDEDLIAIRPKNPTARRVNITSSQQAELSWLTQIILPGLVLIAGIVLWLKRR